MLTRSKTRGHLLIKRVHDSEIMEANHDQITRDSVTENAQGEDSQGFAQTAVGLIDNQQNTSDNMGDTINLTEREIIPKLEANVVVEDRSVSARTAQVLPTGPSHEDNGESGIMAFLKQMSNQMSSEMNQIKRNSQEMGNQLRSEMVRNSQEMSNQMSSEIKRNSEEMRSEIKRNSQELSSQLSSKVDESNRELNKLSHRMESLIEGITRDFGQRVDTVNERVDVVAQEVGNLTKKIDNVEEQANACVTVAETAKKAADEAKSEARSATQIALKVQEKCKMIADIDKNVEEAVQRRLLENTDTVELCHTPNPHTRLESETQKIMTDSDNCTRLAEARNVSFNDTCVNSSNSSNGTDAVTQNSVTVVNEKTQTSHGAGFAVEQFLRMKRFQNYREDGNTLHPKTWISQFDLCLPANWPVRHQLDFILSYLEGAVADEMRGVAANCDSYQSFKREFLRIHWNERTQERIKYEIIMAKPFCESKHQSPVKFFDDLARKNQFLDSPCTVGELIRHCCAKLPAAYRQLLVGKCDVDLNTFKDTLLELELAFGNEARGNANNQRAGNEHSQGQRFGQTGNDFHRNNNNWRARDPGHNNHQRPAYNDRNYGPGNRNDGWSRQRNEPYRQQNNGWRQDAPRYDNDERFSRGNEGGNARNEVEMVEVRGPNPGRRQSNNDRRQD